MTEINITRGPAGAVWECGKKKKEKVGWGGKSLNTQCSCEAPSACWDLDPALERTMNCFIHYGLKSRYYDNQAMFLWRYRG